MVAEYRKQLQGDQLQQFCKVIIVKNSRHIYPTIAKTFEVYE